MMEVCKRHNRWTRIERADGTVSRRDCPECPRPKGARIVNQFTGEVVGRVAVPLVYPATCPACKGTGGGVYNDCATCGGNGVV
jgi:DnaJ-class molecular chaperone